MSDYYDYEDKDEEIRKLVNKNNTQRQQLNAKIRKLEQENKILADDNHEKCREIERLRQTSGKHAPEIVDELKTMQTMINSFFNDKIKILDNSSGPSKNIIKTVAQKSVTETIRLPIGAFTEHFITRQRKQYSERKMIKNAYWRIAVQINVPEDEDEDEDDEEGDENEDEEESNDVEYLGYYLECEANGNCQRSFKVSGEMRLLSKQHSSSDYYYCQRFYDWIFDRKNLVLGFCDYMDCGIIADEDNGYIIDDAIVLEVEFTVE